MHRQYSSRNQRNRGIKVKHALQICLLVAICFWLIYQVKHSHDKHKEFEASDAEGFLDRGSIGGLIRIRRKNIRPLYEAIVTEKKQHIEATDEEETIEEDENTLEEDRSQNKKAEEENEAWRDGDDEHEVEKLDTVVDKDEDKVTDEAREDGFDIETDGNGRKQENSVEDGDRDRGDKSNHEAREEFYEADDASSAVTRDNHTETTEKEKEVVGMSDQHHENILEQEGKENHDKEANNGRIKKRLELDGDEKSDDANPSRATDFSTNITFGKTKGKNSDRSEKGSSLTEAPTDNNLEASNSTTDVTAENPKLSLQNVGEILPELDHDTGIVTEGKSTQGSNLKTIGLQQANNSTLAVEIHLSDSNSTGHTEPKNSESNLDDFSKPSNDTDSFTFLRMSRSEHSLENGTNTEKNEIVSVISDSADS